MRTGRAVDEGECQISGSQPEFNMPGRGAGLLAKAERSLAISCMSWSWSSCGTSLGSVLSLAFSGGESWGSSSENSLQRELVMALTLSKERLCLFLDEW